MATETAKAKTSRAVASSQHAGFVAQRINTIRRQIKLVDLFSALMLFAAAGQAFLLLVAVVDHWIFPLGFWGRLLALLVLISGALACLVGWVGPLLVRKINPVYAARAIEQSEPTLKNSLINFLLFRAGNERVRQRVYQALERKAAADLSHVRVEAAVDRSQLIVIGYVLAAVAALGAAYKIFSPKDPFQTIARVAAPWSDIPRPSRVQIEEVKPGNSEVYQGDLVAVSARVRGLADSDLATLVYSTADGQIIDHRVPMLLAADGLRRECQLPPHAAGVQQNLAYRIEAGDAVTSTFQLTVRPAPTIVIHRVEYEYPAYTGRPPRTLVRQGDLRALEGTRVTIRARASEPIQTAFIELFPAGDSPNGQEAERRKVVPLDASDREAWGGFTLELEADRQTPWCSTYQLRFVTQEGQRNARPILHQIEVLRDLAPEVEVLAPERDRMTLPENGRQTVRVRAVDPDFALRTIKLQGVSAGAEVLSEPLLNSPNGREGQVVESFAISPRKLGLAAGDQLVFWVVAEDNRTWGPDNASAPNVSRTRDYRIDIVEATPSESSEEEESDESSASAEEDDEDESQDGEESEQGEEGGSQDSEEGGEGEQDTGEQSDNDESGDQPNGENDGAEESEGEQSSDEQGGSPQPTEGDSADTEQEGEASGEGTPNSSSGEGDTEGEGQGEGGKPKAEGGGASGQPSPSEQPPSEPLHDGEVIERINDYIKRQQTPPSDRTGPSQPTESAGSPNDSAADAGSDTSEDSGNESDDAQDERQQSGEGGSAGQRERESDSSSQPEAESGAGGSPQGGGGPEEDPDSQGEQDQETEQHGPGLGDEGDAGAGRDQQDKTGAPQSQEFNRDRQKDPSQTPRPPENDSEAQSPSISPRQSDSEGQESGDRSGGGGKGGGQGADQAGRDSSGSNEAADEGAGAAPEPGAGETGSNPGDKQPAGDSQGGADGQTGEGSDRRPGQGDQPDGAPGDAAAEGQSPTTTSPQSGDGVGPAHGGSLPGDRQGETADAESGVAPSEEEANLEYARKATDLALEYLRQRHDRPDPELLEELNWTREDWQAFQERWRRIKRAAQEEGEAGEQEWLESLRSLGLRPERERVRGADGGGDDLRGLRDAGGRSAPPAAYAEQFDAFRKGAARGPEQ